MAATRVFNFFSAAICILFLALCVGCGMHRTVATGPSQFPKAASTFTPPSVQRVTLSNGLRVIYIQDSEIPVVQAELYIPRGGLWGSNENPAAFSAMGELMRAGGAGSLSPEELDRELLRLSASISTQAGGEFTSASFACLKGDLKRVASLFADVVINPKFDSAKLDVWKTVQIDGIKRRHDDGGTIADISFSQLLYGNSVYGQQVISKDVAGLSRLDLLRLHRKFVKPEGAIITISGDLSLSQAQQILEEIFSTWQGKPAGEDSPPTLNNEPSPGVYFLEFPFVQSVVRIGQLGPKRLSPDYLAIEAFNQIFGNSFFGSRLMQRIREELGYTYGIYGSIMPGVEKGMNLISFETKAATTGPAIAESIAVLSELQKKAAKESELQAAKLNISNSFIFKFDSIPELAKRRATISLLKYPENYDETYLPGIQRLTLDDVLAVAKSRWDISKLVILVVGNSSAYNSLQSSMNSAPQYFNGLKIQKVNFVEKLER